MKEKSIKVLKTQSLLKELIPEAFSSLENKLAALTIASPKSSSLSAASHGKAEATTEWETPEGSPLELPIGEMSPSQFLNEDFWNISK